MVAFKTLLVEYCDSKPMADTYTKKVLWVTTLIYRVNIEPGILNNTENLEVRQKQTKKPWVENLKYSLLSIYLFIKLFFLSLKFKIFNFLQIL